MKKKLLITILLAIAVLITINAATVDEILESAKKTSPSYQNILLNYQNGLLTVAELGKDDEIGVALSVTVDPLSEVYSGGSTTPSSLTDTSSKGLTATPTAQITFPNDGNTTISGGARISTRYEDGSTSISGEVGVSHTFDFSGYSSKHSEDLKYASTKYSTELTYSKAELSFETSVLKMISSILSAESSIKRAQFNLKKQQTAFDKLTALKTYSEDSSVYKSTLNTLNALESSLSSTEEQYNSLLSRYKTLTGLAWEGVDVGEPPVLTLTTYENGNTEVMIESLNAESSEESYKSTLASSKPSKLVTSLSLSASSSKYDISGSLQYAGNNWSITAKPGVSISSDGDTTPSLTLAGSWKNNEGSITSGSALSSALNNAKVAANNYLEALSTYEENATNYALEIVEWNTKLSQAKADLEYKETLLESAQALYDLGLNTSEELESAELEYTLSKTDYDKVIIEGLSLERDLAIFAL